MRKGRTATPNCDRLISVRDEKDMHNGYELQKDQQHISRRIQQGQKSSSMRVEEDATGIVDPSPVASDVDPIQVRRRPKISRAVFP